MIIVAHNDRSFLFVSLCVHYTGGGNDGSGNENDATELALVDTTNDPQHAGQEDGGVLARSGVDVEGDAGGGSFVKRTQYRKLSKDQSDELEAAFQQNNFIDKVGSIFLTLALASLFGFQSRAVEPLLNELP